MQASMVVAAVVVGTRPPRLRCRLLQRILHQAEQSKGRALGLDEIDKSMSEMSVANCLLCPCQKRKKETTAGDTNH